jgi:hypothetical protein
MNDGELTEAEINADPEATAMILERSQPGWWRVSGPFAQMYVRCRLDESGGVVIAAVVVAPEGQQISTLDLRRLPLGRILAALNHPRNRDWASAGPAGIDVIRQLEEAADEGPVASDSAGDRREALTRPPRSGDDDFYRNVAEAYRFYVLRSNKPAVEIAAEASVPVATARRWIVEARRRGHLDPGHRGRITG